MISRQTIFSLLLALLLGLGILLWTQNRRDDCDRADRFGRKPTEVLVEQGSRVVAMSCKLWIPRQPQPLQGALLLDAVLGIVFGLSAWVEWNRTRARRKERAGW